MRAKRKGGHPLWFPGGSLIMANCVNWGAGAMVPTAFFYHFVFTKGWMMINHKIVYHGYLLEGVMNAKLAQVRI